MQCLTYSECDEWCSRRGYSTRQFEGHIVGPDPDIQSPPFHFAEFTPPTDSGGKVAFARFLYSLVDPMPELLFWVGDWSVWPSSSQMPLFTRFREALGERRHLIDAPGQLLKPGEADDSVSILVMSLHFIWDCHIFTASGRDVLFVSHDEFGWFASRDVSVAETAGQNIEKFLG